MWKGCVTSYMLNLCTDGVVKEVKARVLEMWTSMQSVGSVGTWELSQLLFADDTVLVADLTEKL